MNDFNHLYNIIALVKSRETLISLLPPHLCYNALMELTSPKIIKELLSRYETRPSKGLGQNFLISENILEKIIEAADVKPTDTILEVGPGIGVLTQELAKKAKRVVAIEKDETMIEILKETLKAASKSEPRQGRDFKNVEVINEDILKLDISSYIDTNYKVVANIPYYITAPLIRSLLENKNQPELIVLMLQKEVAQRICSVPPDMSLLAVSVQFYAEPKIVAHVPKSCFWPSPKIDSAIIKIVPHSNNRRSSIFGVKENIEEKVGEQAEKIGEKLINTDAFFRVVKAGFSQPRKQLGNNLSKMLKIERGEIDKLLLKNNIKPTQRAETLSIENWKILANSL